MAWTNKDSLQPPKAADRLVNTTGIRLRNGACVVYRIVVRCLDVGVGGTAVFNLSDAANDGSVNQYTLTFNKKGEVFELRWRNGWKCGTGLGADISTGGGVCMIDLLIASPKPA